MSQVLVSVRTIGACVWNFEGGTDLPVEGTTHAVVSF